MSLGKKTGGRKPGGEKTGGRKKGTPNKITKDIREQLKDIFQANLPRLSKEMSKMESKDFVSAMGMIAPYVTPKLASATVDAKTEMAHKLDGLSVEQIDQVIETVINSYMEEDD